MRPGVAGPRAAQAATACGEPGATNGQGIARSATRARSSSNCSRWWPASTCSPTGSPSTDPAGIVIPSDSALIVRPDGSVVSRGKHPCERRRLAKNGAWKIEPL